ncbi:MAG TPA: caspase family protein [Pyrinomonadaceae bacterium]|nr:caspase family protein [Pyrinomonadaceae bacterium]
MKLLIAPALCLALTLSSLPARAGLGIRPITKKTLHVLTIGINEYKDEQYRLKYSVADSREFAAAIERGGKNAFDAVVVRSLTDAQATSAAVEAEFAHVAREARPDDTFIFHFAGTGKAIADETGAPVVYMATSDITLFSDGFAELKAKAVSGRMLGAWSSKIQARRQLFLLDSCESGAAFNNLSESIAGGSRAERELAGKSVVVMGMEGFAYERAALGHGEFSYAVIEGLKGEADLSGDGLITARELQAHMYSKLPKMRVQQKADIAFPKIYESGEDFTVAALRKPAPTPTPAAEAAQAKPEAQSPPAKDRDTTNTKATSGAAGAAARREGKDYAILFATNEYDDEGFTDLDNPVLDARAIAKELKQSYGFETLVVENPKLDDIYTVLRQYAERKYGVEDQLFVFFAGHGAFDEVVKEGFIVARDSRKNDTNKSSYLAHSRLNSIIDNIGCPHTLMLLDVCFGGSFTDHVRKNFNSKARDETVYSNMFSGVELFKKKAEFTTRKFLASGANVPVSDGVAGLHSPFAAKMLEALRSYPGSGYLTFGDIKKSVERVKPGPVDADFGRFLPGSDFFFLLGGS